MRKTAILLLLIIWLPVLALAQESRGTIFGSITDPQGAAVPDVSVTITNAGTNAAKKTVANERGYYEVPLLDPGDYSVSVEVAGFQKFVHSGIIVNVNSRAEVNIQLRLGNLTETVTVVSEAPLLETSTASSGRLIDHRQVMELPYSDMNPYVLQGLAPGMQWTGAPDANRTLWSGGGTSAFNTAGGVGMNEYSIDGTPNTGSNKRAAFIPPTDAVGEFRLETANFDASFGHTSGATVNLSIKSGTNEYHGSLNNQHWQQRWNATQHFARLAWEDNVRKGLVSPDSQKQQSGRSNSPGATIGGPVRIPWLFNGKDKLFFFFNYAGIYANSTDQPDRLPKSVPKEAWRNGDFSDLLAIDPVLYQIYDPRTARTVGNRVVRDPFPGNKGIPILNPMYASYAKIYPLPNNVPGLVTKEGANNYFAANMPKIDRHHSLLNRIDWEVSQRHKISGRWYWNRRKANTQDWTYETVPGLHSDGTTRFNKAVGIDWVWTINAKNVFNLTAAFNRFIEYSGRPGPAMFKPSDVGLPTYLDQRAGANAILPYLDFSTLQDISYPIAAVTRASNGTLKGQLLRIQGNHSLKFGFDIRKNYRAVNNPGYSSGRFIFNNSYTRAASDTSTASNTGLEWAAFMMSYPSTITIDTNDSSYLVNPFTSFYVQDDLRVTNRLRLNIGLRAEIEGGATERYNRGLAGGYFSTDKLPISDPVEAAYAKNPIPQLPAANFKIRGGTRYLGQNAPTTVSEGTSNLLPRLGAVYQLSRKMVIRAGYGWFFDTNNVTNFDINQSGYSQATAPQITANNGVTFTTTLKDPFPVRADGTRFTEPLQNALGNMGLAGQGVSYIDPIWKAAFQQRWRLSLQYELSHNLVFEIGYTGSYSKTNIAQRMDPLPEAYWATGMVRNSAVDTSMNATAPNPLRITNLTALQTSDPVLYNYLSNQSRFTGSTLRVQELLRAYPQYSSVSNIYSPDGRVRYRALELQLEKRFSRGFQFTFMYTYSNSQSRDFYANEFDPLPSWRPNVNTMPHRFAFSAIYELPFGKGKRFLSQHFLGRVLGGWQLSTVYQWQSGPPISWGNEFYYGNMEDIATAFNHSIQNTDIHQWFDPKMQFEKDSAKRPGTYHVRVFPQSLDSLRSDGINNLDLRILRNFGLLRENRLKAQLSLDLLNALNRTNFAAPNVDPRNTNFGRVTAQRGLSRIIQVNLRFLF